LWLSPASATWFDSPADPSAATRRRGTRNSEMPLVPGGPPGILASTMCTMFSASSCSPAEIHILLPLR
jgi:hypothetical protein